MWELTSVHDVYILCDCQKCYSAEATHLVTFTFVSDKPQSLTEVVCEKCLAKEQVRFKALYTQEQLLFIDILMGESEASNAVV